MNDCTRNLKTFLTENRINAFGAASASSLETEPEGYRPSDTITGAKSILCLGIPIPKGVFQNAGRAELLYWRAAAVYYRHLDAILIRAAALIEEEGEIAVPVYG
jgi:epoxyqueuosine reductase QueG